MRRSELRAAGFTLIEVTMVLILLGILAAVAVPKYFDMQEEARIKAANSAIAEAQARINAYFGQLLLEGNSCEQAVAGLNADLRQNAGQIADATDDNGKVFGEVTLKIGGELLATVRQRSLRHSSTGSLWPAARTALWWPHSVPGKPIRLPR